MQWTCQAWYQNKCNLGRQCDQNALELRGNSAFELIQDPKIARPRLILSPDRKTFCSCGFLCCQFRALYPLQLLRIETQSLI